VSKGRSRLAAILEEQHFRGSIASEVKTNGAITSNVVSQYAATRAPAVDLVDAQVISEVKLTPSLDENGTAGFFSEQGLERWTFVLDVGHRPRRFDLTIIQTSTRQQLSPGGRYDADSHPRIEAGRGILPRVGAKRYAQGFDVAHFNRNPEVIDVTRDFVGLRGEGDRNSRHAHKLSLSPARLWMLAALAVSMWQSEIEYGSPQSPVEPRESESWNSSRGIVDCHPEAGAARRETSQLLKRWRDMAGVLCGSG
jgi:hypothetical protein